MNYEYLYLISKISNIEILVKNFYLPGIIKISMKFNCFT